MKFSRYVIPALSIIILFSTGHADQAEQETKLKGIAESYYQLLFKFNPVYATEMGKHSFDDRYPDFSKRARGSLVSSLKNVRGRLRKVKQDELTPDGAIDFHLLRNSIEADIEKLSRSVALKDNPILFSTTALAGIYQIMISRSLPDSTRLEHLLARLGDLPRFLKSAAKVLDEPSHLWLSLAEEEGERGLVFLSDLAAYLTTQYPQQRPEIEAKFATATNSLAEFIDLLDALKLSRDGSYALGIKQYNKMLKYRHNLDFDSDSLLLLGQSILSQIGQRLDSVAAIVDTLTPLLERDYFIPRSFQRQDVIDYFQWELNQTLVWLGENGFAALPDGPGSCIAVETPTYLNIVIGGINYFPPGPFDSDQTGLFFLRPLPDSLDDAGRTAFFRYGLNRGFRSSTVHDGYPGRHLLLQFANQNSSVVRRLTRSRLMVDGWALYCQEVMYDMGFYGDDPRLYLTLLTSERLSATRLIVDMKLQCGQFNFNQAVEWLTEELGLPVEYTEREVEQIASYPGRAICATLGKYLISESWRLYRLNSGNNASLHSFHNQVLSKGAIPPSYLFGGFER